MLQVRLQLGLRLTEGKKGHGREFSQEAVVEGPRGQSQAHIRLGLGLAGG